MNDFTPRMRGIMRSTYNNGGGSANDGSSAQRPNAACATSTTACCRLQTVNGGEVEERNDPCNRDAAKGPRSGAQLKRGLRVSHSGTVGDLTRRREAQERYPGNKTIDSRRTDEERSENSRNCMLQGRRQRCSLIPCDPCRFIGREAETGLNGHNGIDSLPSTLLEPCLP